MSFTIPMIYHLFINHLNLRKDTNKRARNKKLASIFFTASAVYVRSSLQS